MYTTENFKTKKQLKEAVASGKHVSVYQPNDMFGNPAARADFTGQEQVEGPHAPMPHRWYATVEIVQGRVVKVS